MNTKIKLHTIKNKMQIIPIIILVLFSKTMYFGVEIRSRFQYVFYGISLMIALFFGISKKTFKKNCIQWVSIIIIILLHILLEKGNEMGDSINSIAGQLLTIISCIMIASSISRVSFCQSYILVMVIMSIISFPMFVIGLVNPSLAKSLARTTMKWENPYEYSIFYTWGRHGIILQRNSGMFWEPGAFQAFIVIALLLMISLMVNNHIDKKKLAIYKLYFIILITALLTTQSTTGFIICIVYLIVFNKDIVQLFSIGQRGKTAIKLFIIVLTVLTVQYIVFSNNISNKLNNVDNDSANIRYNDLLISIRLFFSKKGFFVGLGNTHTRQFLEYKFNIEKNSVGILKAGYTYGSIFLLSYLYLCLKGLRSYFPLDRRKYFIVFFVIFIILGCTENLIYLPTFILLLCDFKRNDIS